MEIFDWLNSYSGLFSLLAVIAAVFVPYRIYRKQRKDEIQAIKDELEAMKDVGRFPMANSERDLYTRKYLLEKRLKHK